MLLAHFVGPSRRLGLLPYFSILIVRVVVAPHFLHAYVKSHRSVSSETATGGDGVIGRLQPGQVTVG
jgi:hypothetical protein